MSVIGDDQVTGLLGNVRILSGGSPLCVAQVLDSVNWSHFGMPEFRQDPVTGVLSQAPCWIMGATREQRVQRSYLCRGASLLEELLEGDGLTSRVDSYYRTPVLKSRDRPVRKFLPSITYNMMAQVAASGHDPWFAIRHTLFEFQPKPQGFSIFLK